MALVPKIIKGIGQIIRPDKVKYVSSAVKAEYQSVMHFKTLGSNVKIVEPGIKNFRIKPDIVIPINTETLHLQNPAFPITWKALEANKLSHQAELGNVSYRLAKKYKAAENAAKAELKEIFPNFEVSVRSKGANSVYSKLERVTKKTKQTIKTDEDARNIILDAIGGRIQLKDLTRRDVLSAIDNVKINGKNLTSEEKTLVLKYFDNQSISPSEIERAKELVKPVKIALAEKQTDPVINKFLLSGMKDALNRGTTTLEKLEKAGIRKDLLKELAENPNIKPCRITEINNYKGEHGVAYFSDRQIKEFEKLQLATGEKIDIISCPEDIDLAKYGLSELPKSAKDAIKKSGYTTGQINVVLSDGNYAEVQVRGSSIFPEYEHLKYDASLDKNTLGRECDEYKHAVQALTPEQSKSYDHYIESCYDYYRDAELGSQRKKPILPETLDKVLSEDSMRSIYELQESNLSQKMKTFVPHFEEIDGSKKFVV